MEVPSDPEESLDAVREAALRAGLEEYELTEDDLAALAGEAPAETEAALPTLAVIGRPNVGKSTLVNRIIGKRLAVVEDTPGVTRDRREAEGRIAELTFRLLDTAGFEDVT
ncbi:GTPase, partial [uncultured Demequina sp.]|uniref:GTPase n=1 Tax=uncultured Demequina sp. TaxID=693499 RepID=UPI0025E5E9F4